MSASLHNLNRLNLGCGPNALEGWVNLDSSWNAWLTHHPHLRRCLTAGRLISQAQANHWTVRPVIHDLRRPLPFPDGKFSAIYASHVLEHLYFSDAEKLLWQCNRVLQPGGVLRIVVPDLHALVADYLSGQRDSQKFAADRLNEMLAFRGAVAAGGNVLFRFYSAVKDFHSHKWMYDAESLAGHVARAGFCDVAEKHYLESDIPGIEEVEQADRVLEGAGICIEARKPR